MKIKEILHALSAYYNKVGLGHTTAMINGAKNTDKIIVIVYTLQYVDKVLRNRIPNAKMSFLYFISR